MNDQRRMLERFAGEAEVRRCKRDKRYFIENYWHIPVEGSAGGRALFKLWDFQVEAFDALQSNKRVVIAKCRQLGMTTLTMADTAHGLFFADDRYDVLVLSWREDMAQSNIALIEFGHNYLPDWMKRLLPQRADRTKAKITFTHRDGRTTEAVAFSGTARSGAGKASSRVVLDEFGLMDNPGAVYRAVEPTTLSAMRTANPEAVFVVLSTARGNRNQFASIFWSAWNNESSWKALFFPVMCNRFLAPPDVTEDEFWEAWRSKMNTEYQGNEHQFYADYPRSAEEAFRESGRGRFQHLPELADCPPFPFSGFFVRSGRIVKLDLAKNDLDRDAAHIHLSCDPNDIDKTQPFVISADPSGGVGRDFHAAQVLQPDPDEPGKVNIVAYIHRNDIDPMEFADILDMAGRFFTADGQKAALMVVERMDNSEGEVIARLRQRRYPSFFRYTALDRVTKRPNPVYGWPINGATKPEAINALARLLGAVEDEEGQLVAVPKLGNIYPELRDELVNFVIIERSTGRIEMKADGNGNDDLVTSTAIGAAVLERVTRNKTSTFVPTIEGVSVPDGPVSLFDPNKVIKREIKRGEQRRRREAHEWKRTVQARKKREKKARR